MFIREATDWEKVTQKIDCNGKTRGYLPSEVSLIPSTMALSTKADK